MMNRGSTLAQEVLLCHHCGRILEPYETCDCAQRLPRDGLRASCPHFKARSTYRGKNYINCVHGKLRFESRNTRDQYYMDNCCSRGPEGCRARHKEGGAHG